MWARAWLLVILSSGATLAQDYIFNPLKPADSGPLFRIQRGDKWGFMDRTGKVVIRAQFEDADHFFEGRARVRKDDQWGFVDETGRLVIPYQFPDAERFREGVAPVRIGRAWGFIDLKGTVVIEPRFQGAAPFREGLARVETWDRIECRGKVYTAESGSDFELRMHPGIYFDECVDGILTGFIDHTGNFAIPPAAIKAEDFSEGLAAFTPGSSAYSGYMDRSGKVVIEPQFGGFCRSFREGMATVTLRTDGNDYGAIAPDGRWIIDPKFDSLGSFSEGLASACVEIFKRCGFVNNTGEFVIPPVFFTTQEFVQGWALVDVYKEDGTHPTYVNRTGAIMLPTDYAYFWPFVDGLTIVGFEGTGQCYVDRQGKFVAEYNPPDRHYRSRWSRLKLAPARARC